MQRWDSVAIVGVGLIGGSVGLALTQRGLARRVVGIGRRAASLRKARRCGAVTAATTRLANGVSEAMLIVVCTPVAGIAEQVREASEHCPAGALITDAGSVKAAIVRQLQPRAGSRLYHDAAFVGSHPLAGSEKAGPEYARADLLEGRTVVVTPTEHTRRRDVAAIASFWRALGARVIRMSPEEHDAALAATSHTPHLTAAALAAATPAEWLPLTAAGWLDTTRVAAGDPDLWRQILAANRRHVLRSLDKFAKVLSSFRQALAEDDQQRILELLKAGKDRRDAVGG